MKRRYSKETAWNKKLIESIMKISLPIKIKMLELNVQIP